MTGTPLKGTLVLAILAVALAGCGAATPRPPTAAGVHAYEAALGAALDDYEAEARQAARQTYPSELIARATREELSDPEMAERIREALAARGLTEEGLATASARHPGFASEQNARFRERLRFVRPFLWSIETRTVPSDMAQPMVMVIEPHEVPGHGWELASVMNDGSAF